MVHHIQPELTNKPTLAATKAEIELAAAKPPIPIVNLDAIPERLRLLPNWCLWVYSKNKDGRWTKVPLHPIHGQTRWHLHNASSTNPNTWNDFSLVSAFYRAAISKTPDASSSWIGLGFFLSVKNNITVIDLDDARNRDTGELTPKASAIVDQFSTYSETSPSGTGLKVFATGAKPGHRCKIKTHPGIEVFDNVRFVAITGLPLNNTPPQIESRQNNIDTLYAEMFAEAEAAASTASARARESDPRQTPFVLNLTDQDIISIASRAKNGHRFLALWNGDLSGFPSASEADLELASRLAFWCGGDYSWIESLMRQSGLRRAKWDRHKTYLRGTIERAITGKTDFYDPHRKRPFTPHPEVANIDFNLPLIIDDHFGPDGKPFTFIAIGDSSPHHPSIDLTPEQRRESIAAFFDSLDDPKNIAALAIARAEEKAKQERQNAEISEYEQRRRARARLCPKCSGKLQVRKDGTGACIRYVGCDRWDCHVCRQNNIERWQLTFARHLQNDAPATLYSFYCPDASWAYVQVQLREIHAKYYRVTFTGMVYATAAPERGPGANAVPIDRAIALDALTKSVEQTPETWHRSHPITHSRDWGFPDKGPGLNLYTNHGKVAGGPAVAISILHEFGVHFTLTGPRTIFARIRRTIYFQFPEQWSSEHRMRLLDSLANGEVIEDASAIGTLVFVTDDSVQPDSDGSYSFSSSA